MAPESPRPLSISGRRDSREKALFKGAGRFFGGGFSFWEVVPHAGRLGSEAWLAGSRVRLWCPTLTMYMQQRWEVEEKEPLRLGKFGL